MPHTRRRLRSGLRPWASPARVETVELHTHAARAGCLSISEAPDREMVTVQGTLRTVTLRPRGGVPALEAELDDGSGTITVLWLGRRRIAGIFPGRSIRVTGRIGVHGGVRVMYNPRYDLRY
jgi:hypothetical protein